MLHGCGCCSSEPRESSACLHMRTRGFQYLLPAQCVYVELRMVECIDGGVDTYTVSDLGLGEDVLAVTTVRVVCVCRS